jgi:signal transduction histidine kinase
MPSSTSSASRTGAAIVSLGQVAVGIAHEVNNPLTIILGSANIIQKLVDQDPIPRDEVRMLTDKMIANIGRIFRTIRSLKSLS